MAMGGAYMLAEALHTVSDHETAFRRYASQVRPYVEQRQKSARSSARIFLPGNWLELAIQRLTMNLLLRESWSGLLRQQFGAESLLSPQEFH